MVTMLEVINRIPAVCTDILNHREETFAALTSRQSTSGNQSDLTDRLRHVQHQRRHSPPVYRENFGPADDLRAAE